MNIRDYDIIQKERLSIAQGLRRFNSLQEAISAVEEGLHSLDKNILSRILELDQNS